MVNLVMAHMAYLKTGRTNTNLSVLEQFPYPKLFYFGPIRLQWHALASVLLCCVYCCSVWITGFSIQMKSITWFYSIWSNLDFLDVCSPLTIVSFVVDYHHPRGFPPGAGGHRSPHKPPCTSCPHAGACPWCRWMLQWLNLEPAGVNAESNTFPTKYSNNCAFPWVSNGWFHIGV